MTEDESKAAAEDLAKRIRLLLDVRSLKRDPNRPTRRLLRSFRGRGINLSRSRWTYMVNGHRYVRDRLLFEGLAEFFASTLRFWQAKTMHRCRPGSGPSSIS